MSGTLGLLSEALVLEAVANSPWTRHAARRMVSGMAHPPRSSEAPALYLVRTQPVPDPITRAEQLMRARLEQRWTVNQLARQVGMSRPVFARKFREATGLSPLRYLTQRRMERAAELLVQSELGLSAVAEHVGYVSEFAFNRAFKRYHALAPGSFRRRALERGMWPSLRAA
ncbi:MAG: AraC family transcriptional regulator [Myxococcales bacterium]